MTHRDIKLLSWVCLAFGWIFSLLSASILGLAFLLAAFVLFSLDLYLRWEKGEPPFKS